MTKYFNDNQKFFNWLKENKDKFNIVKVITDNKKKNHIKVIYETITN